MAGPVARYFATLQFKIDKGQLREIDKTLLNIENKLKAFQRRIGSAMKISIKVDSLNIDQKRLEVSAKTALDKASKSTVFEISRFAINDRNLQAALMRAGRAIGQRVGTGQPQVIQPQPVPQPAQPTPPKQNVVAGRSHYMHAGGAAGAFARYGVQSLPFIGGVYGLGQVNAISQELQANQLALQAVAGSQAGMYEQYLNNLGTRMGMTTRQLQPSFTQYLANAQGTALESTLMRDFESFTQYGAVMGLGPEEMKGSLKAITQMVSKQQIYAEELRGQLAERMPAAVKLMAEAVTGGDTKALIEMMAAGKLDPNEVLPKFFERMRGISEPMLPKYFQTSRFAQGQMAKATEEQIKVFAGKGGDEGFTRFFNLMSEAIRGAQPLITGLAGAFNRLTIAMQAPVNLFKNMNEALSVFSEMTGVSEGKVVSLAAAGALMATKFGRVFAIFTGLAMVLEDISFGMQGKDSYTKDFLDFLEGKGIVSGELSKGLMGMSTALLAIAAALKAVSLATSLPGIGDMFGSDGDKNGKGAKAGWSSKMAPLLASLGIVGATAGGLGYAAYKVGETGIDARNAVVGSAASPFSPYYNNATKQRDAQNLLRDKTSPYYNNAPLLEEAYRQQAAAQTQQYIQANMAAGRTALPGITPMNVNVEVKAEITAENAEDFSQKLGGLVKQVIKGEFQQTLSMIPVKE